MNSTQRAPSAVRQTPRTHLCTYDGSSTVRVTQGCHVGLLAVMACAPCFDPLLCKHHQLHRRWSDHPILAHRQVQNSPRIYGKTKVIPKAGTRFSTLGRRPKAIHTLTVVGITSKAWAWISWIQGSSFLVGLGHILFQLRQLLEHPTTNQVTLAQTCTS